MKRKSLYIVAACIGIGIALWIVIPRSPVDASGRIKIEVMTQLLEMEAEPRQDALAAMKGNLQTGDIGMLLEASRFFPIGKTRTDLFKTLQSETGQDLGADEEAWFRWLWQQDVDLHPQYATFKKTLFQNVDPRFAEYFDDKFTTKIRLDEVRWGGVKRDQIPPLNNPDVIAADEATWLADTDVVFGVTFNGESRAYPKRILAWHEMVKDTVGGKPINGVYCTLCGSMIVYDPIVDGTHHELGTSGFLYRSNKLMYDHATKSLWSTLKGKPVVGPLADTDIRLPVLEVVTTTWGKWRSRHPRTDVLSLETGHIRDYGEGVAYKEYFSNDDLMFAVPSTDDRLRNKAEVFIVRQPAKVPLAISAEFLKQQSVYSDRVGKTDIVIVTDSSGANRAYESGGMSFSRGESEDTLIDESGAKWTVTDNRIVLQSGESGEQRELIRLPAHRAFWFGWHAAFPETRLVK